MTFTWTIKGVAPKSVTVWKRALSHIFISIPIGQEGTLLLTLFGLSPVIVHIKACIKLNPLFMCIRVAPPV